MTAFGTINTTLDLEGIKAITIEAPTSSEDVSFYFAQKASTIRKLVAVLTGSASPSVTWTLRKASDRSATGVEVVTGGTTTTSLTTGSVITSFNSATITAADFLWIETTAMSGTVLSLSITMFYDP